MKLLFDQNLSSRLMQRLADMYTDASHVSLVGLDRATDLAVWDFARANGFCIVTKDADFNDLVVLQRFPPKVIWLRLGNCTTAEVEQVLRRGYAQINDFDADHTAGILELT